MNNTIQNLGHIVEIWDTDTCNATLVSSIMALGPCAMPLQQGLSQGDMASERPEKVTVMSSHETESEIIIKLGVFFTEIISGCSCGDDPVSLNGYCEMQLTIDKLSGEANFRVTG